MVPFRKHGTTTTKKCNFIAFSRPFNLDETGYKIILNFSNIIIISTFYSLLNKYEDLNTSEILSEFNIFLGLNKTILKIPSYVLNIMWRLNSRKNRNSALWASILS